MAAVGKCSWEGSHHISKAAGLAPRCHLGCHKNQGVLGPAAAVVDDNIHVVGQAIWVVGGISLL